MPTITVTDTSTFTPAPAGTYIAECTTVEADEGQFGPSFKWVWKLTGIITTDDDDEAEAAIGQDIWGWSSQSGSLRSKLVQWYGAHLNVPMQDNMRINTDDCIGKSVKLTLVHITREDGSPGHKIAAVSPYKPKSRKPRIVEEDDDDAPVQNTARKAPPQGADPWDADSAGDL